MYTMSRDHRVEVEDLDTAARGLSRPECVLALRDGRLIASHGSGGYSVVPAQADSPVRHVTPSSGDRDYVSNGIALGDDGRVRFAHLGAVYGGVFAIDASGRVTPEIEEVDGEQLPPTNYVTHEADGATWFTVMTRTRPRHEAWRTDTASGFIAVSDSRGVRIVADALGYTNEIAFSPDGRWVYVNETYARRVSRFRLLPGHELGERETVTQLEGGDIPDGLAFDEEGGLWVTCIGSNRLLVIRPDGEVQVVLADTDEALAGSLGDRLTAGTLTFEDMQTAGASRLDNISSIAFGGHDLRTVYLGCLLGDRIRSFRAPVRGAVLPHWTRPLGDAR